MAANPVKRRNAISEPKFDLVGPTVDDDIRRAIGRYGPDAVKDAVKHQTKAKRGRTPIDDWPELREMIIADGKRLLSGGDPFAERPNYSIAKEYADRDPGHSHPSTMKRIERKLAEGRVLRAFLYAMRYGYKESSYKCYIRILEMMYQRFPIDNWRASLMNAQSTIADYAAKKGHSPPATMTMKLVEDAAREPLPLPPPTFPVTGGILSGSRSK